MPPRPLDYKQDVATYERPGRAVSHAPGRTFRRSQGLLSVSGLTNQHLGSCAVCARSYTYLAGLDSETSCLSGAASSKAVVMASHGPLRPVIVISGANSGAGFGLAQRLLVQLSSPTPPDTLPVHPQLLPPGDHPVASPFSASHGCVLIMACRNAIKAHRARAQLQSLLRYLEELPDDAETPQSVPASVLAEPLESKVNGMIDEDADPALVAQAMEASLRRRRRRTAAVSLSSEEGGDEERDLTRDPRTGRTYTLYEREIRARGRYRRRFCSQTVIEIQALDLGSMASALNCAKEITARHHYVTHVVMNAGSSAFTGINWPYAVWMMIINFHNAVTYPQYKLQRAGDIGKDGHGWVWQANVGAHYVLVSKAIGTTLLSLTLTPSFPSRHERFCLH